MVCGFNKLAKIFTGLGCCFIIIGVIALAAAQFSVSSGSDIEFGGGSRSFRYNVPSGDGAGYGLYIRQSDNCVTPGINWGNDASRDPQISITHVATGETASNYLGFGDHTFFCSAPQSDPEHYENIHDPPLRGVGSFAAAVDNNRLCDRTDQCSDSNNCNPICYRHLGDYQFTASTDVWVMDLDEELAEAVGGILGAIVLLIVMVVVIIVGAILLAIACCCCCQGPDKQAVGSPVPGMVVGQPVGSA